MMVIILFAQVQKKKIYTANTPTMNMGNDGYKTI